MSIERRITFIIDDEGFATWKIKRLKTLSDFFRSVVILQNITIGEMINTANMLEILSIGCKRNDLCQLWIEGSDAELACMVLTDFIDEQFTIVNTSHKKNENKTNSIIANHPTFYLPFKMNYAFDLIKVESGLEKNEVILKLSRSFTSSFSDVVFDALLAREAISSTAIGNGIAIPHIVVEGIVKPTISVIFLDKKIDWGGNFGQVKMIIAIMLPSPVSRDVIIAMTQLTRSLIDSVKCDLLTTSVEPEAIKAILFHFMASLKV
jgi:PTS system nitrogen regulatory IIA component